MDKKQDFIPIYNKEAFNQGVRYRRPSAPDEYQMTDIDGLYDFQGEAFLFVEYKLKGAPLTKGQKIAGHNLIKTNRKPVVFAFAEHDNTTDEYIDGDFAVVKELWHGTGDGLVRTGNKHVGEPIHKLKSYMHKLFPRFKKEKEND